MGATYLKMVCSAYAAYVAYLSSRPKTMRPLMVSLMLTTPSASGSKKVGVYRLVSPLQPDQ